MEAVLRIGRIAAVLPYDQQRNRLFVLRQFRVGAYIAHGRGANIEVIADHAKPGEDLATTARRGALEQAGIAVDNLEPVLEFMPAPSVLDEQATLFTARADVEAAPAVAGCAEEQETILPMLVSPETLFSAEREDCIRNRYTLIAILWFMLRRPEVDTRGANTT
jgi:ADP-ribose pyrophosphatase